MFPTHFHYLLRDAIVLKDIYTNKAVRSIKLRFVFLEGVLKVCPLAVETKLNVTAKFVEDGCTYSVGNCLNTPNNVCL